MFFLRVSGIPPCSSKLAALQALADEQNRYLAEHPRADQHAAFKKVIEKQERLHLGSLVTVTAADRRVSIEQDSEYIKGLAELDGCYAIKSDLPAEAADQDLIHSLYKDLSMVESAFRTCKADHLELRPVFVQTEASMRGHVLVVMLAYLLVRHLQRAWRSLELTVQEGLEELNKICAMTLSIEGGGSCLRLPDPSPLAKELLSALEINQPAALPKFQVKADTKRKLTSQRK